MNKKVSIIIPVYNCEKYLEDCLNSVENQTYKNIEVIIVNDGSLDNGIDIINKYIEKNNNWKLINQKNQGLSVSRNNGFATSTGEYIFFLDSDDEIPLNSIEILVQSAVKNNSDIVIGNMINYNNGGKYPNYTTKYIKNVNAINYKNYPKLVSFIHAAGKLYKREAIKDIKFISGVKHEDNYFNLSLYLRKLQISMIKDDVYFHRIREGIDKSITQSMNYSSFKDLLINYYKVIEENTIDKKMNIILSKKIANYIYINVEKNKRNLAIQDMNVFYRKMDLNTNLNFFEKIYIKAYRKIYLLFAFMFSYLKMK